MLVAFKAGVTALKFSLMPSRLYKRPEHQQQNDSSNKQNS
jgi:hypothetical protein